MPIFSILILFVLLILYHSISIYAARCFYLPHISLIGGTFDEFAADNIQRCCIACARHQCCVAYTFMDDKCYLKSSFDTSVADAATMSGIKANTHQGQQSLLHNVAFEGEVVGSIDTESIDDCRQHCIASGIYSWKSLHRKATDEESDSCQCLSRIWSLAYEHGTHAGVSPSPTD